MYLYLRESEWIDAWINGGIIPINPASTYLSMERKGIMTPDETLIYESTHDVESWPGFIEMDDVSDITFGSVRLNGKLMGTNIHIKEKRREDGVILSFCNHFSPETAKRLDGKKACVEIVDMELLKSSISKQLGVDCQSGNCQYSESHNRNHFLKSINDKWQDEFRLFWNYPRPIKVEIPKGIAKEKWVLV